MMFDVRVHMHNTMISRGSSESAASIFGPLLMDVQLDLDGFLYLVHILLRQDACAFKEPLFADSRQLVCQGFAFFALRNDCRLTRVELIDVASERDNLDKV